MGLYMCSSSQLVGLGMVIAFFVTIVGYLWHVYNRAALCQIPSAHWSVPLSRAWILWTRYSKREMQQLWQLHQKLGPIVRIGPKELSISRHENGIKTVYGGGYNKPAYYDVFRYYGSPNTFVTFSRHEHAMRRKRVSAVYSKSSLFTSKQLPSVNQEILQNRLESWLAKQASTQEKCDALRMCYALCLDYCDAFIWGLASGSNFMSDPASLEKWLEAYDERYCHELFWLQELPGVSRAMRCLGIDVLPARHHAGRDYLERWLLQLCDQAEVYHNLAQEGRLSNPGDEPAVFSRTKIGIAQDSPHVSAVNQRLEIASELFDHSSGAREVLGMVLAYTLYYIARRPDAQERLRSELLSISETNCPPDIGTNSPSLPSPAALDALPYLTAVLKESFRLRPNSTPLPRITPSDRHVSVAGYDGIPPNTRIAAFQWFVHRDSNLWYQPNDWIPERWLDEKQTGTLPEMDRMLWAFISGPRGCLGQNLTYYMCRYILFYIFTTCKVYVADPETFGQHPPGSLEDRVMLQFERL